MRTGSGGDSSAPSHDLDSLAHFPAHPWHFLNPVPLLVVFLLLGWPFSGSYSSSEASSVASFPLSFS